METRAPFVVVGAFVLAAIGAVFGFVYWLHNTGGRCADLHHVQFDGSVPGLLVGAAVLFNGIRVGEVTDLGLAPDSPRRVNATISVASTTPVQADTKVGLEFQGLTGVPVIALEGGKDDWRIHRDTDADCRSGGRAEHDAGCAQCVAPGRFGAGRQCGAAEEHDRQSAGLLGRPGQEHRKARRHRRRSRKDDRRRRAGSAKVTYDLQAPQDFAAPKKPIKGQIAIPEPTAVVDARRRSECCSRPAWSSRHSQNLLWADSIPKLLQAKLIESFENYDIAHAPLRSMDGLEADVQLLIDVRRFQIK